VVVPNFRCGCDDETCQRGNQFPGLGKICFLLGVIREPTFDCGSGKQVHSDRGDDLYSGNIADISTEVIDGLLAHGKPFHSPTAHITDMV
jgi:hypothetical protein